MNRWITKHFFPSYNTEQLINELKKCGVSTGSNVFIQSAWGAFNKYTGTVHEFIQALLETIGPEGTLGMPAFPRNRYETFDVRNTPSAAGYLTEVFRKYPGVKRSLNSQHSVCAIGPNADHLLNEHHISESCWDERSPYYKMTQINTCILILGLAPKKVMPTIWHCVDSLLKDSYPYFGQLLSKKILVQYIDYNGQLIEHQYFTKPDDLKVKSKDRASFLETYFDRNSYIHSKLSNLIIRSYDSTYTLNRMVELGKKGIAWYEEPDPSLFSWDCQ